MKYFIPTYDQCREICDAQDNFLFFEQKYVVNGYNVSIFDYKLAYANVFLNPVEGKDYLAHELRGLTFVYNADGSIYNHNLLLAKFFNINQCESTQYDLIKDYEIDVVYEKMDGSVVSFVKFPNGDILGKSKASFISDMAVGATDIYNSDVILKRFVDDMLNNDIIPIFEYVSPYNRVVIKYDVEELVLLQLRNNKTGEYLSLDSVPNGIKCAGLVDVTLDELIANCKVIEDTEGCVVRFKSGLLVKEKTRWYLDRHNLLTETLKRENDIIRLILDNTIDDVMVSIDEVGKNIDIEIIQKKINKYITKNIDDTESLLMNFDGNMKVFSNAYGKHPMFHFATSVINNRSTLLEAISNRIRRDTFHLMNAKNFLDKIDLE